MEGAETQGQQQSRRGQRTAHERGQTDTQQPWRNRIGHATWALIHTMPYSIQDTDATDGGLQQAVQTYVTMVICILELYPCGACRQNLRGTHHTFLEDLLSIARQKHTNKDHAIDDLAMWGFRFHNAVTKSVSRDCATTNTFVWLEKEPERDILACLQERYSENGWTPGRQGLCPSG